MTTEAGGEPTAVTTAEVGPDGATVTRPGSEDVQVTVAFGTTAPAAESTLTANVALSPADVRARERSVVKTIWAGPLEAQPCSAFVSVTAAAEVPKALSYVLTSPVKVSVTRSSYWTLVVAAENTQNR